MCFQQISDRAEGKRSAHLDLVTSDRGSAIAQALTLGASLVEEHPHHT